MIEIGCILLIAVYHIILFFQIKRNYYLYLGLGALMVVVRALLVDDGSGLLFQLLPDLDRLSGRKIEYFVTYSNLFLLPMFIGDLYKLPKTKRYIKFFQVVGLLLLLTVLITPYSIFRSTLNVFHVAMLGSFMLVFYILYRAVKSRQVGSKVILIGMFIAFAFVFVEMLKNSRVVPNFDTIGPNLVNTGVVIFFFFQSIALSKIFAKSFAENSKLNRELEERVAARTEQLTKSNLVKERFIQIVSHDIRSPLSNLKALLPLMAEGDIDTNDTKRVFKKIEINLEGSLDMLDELMEWTKTTSEAKSKVYRERINIVNLIEEGLMLFEQVAIKKEIELVFDKKQDQLHVDSDRNAAKVILRNLISNALKFTDTGGIVRVELQIKSNRVEVAVSDTGIGIPDKMKRTLFEMNTKNKRLGTANEKSTGIGLSLCRDLLNQNGGEIWIENNDPRGSVFKFVLDASS